MKNKCTTTTQHSQQIIAGLLPSDGNIEFFTVGNLKTKYIQNGITRSWRDLPLSLYVSCMNHYNKNEKARAAFKEIKEDGKLISRDRKLEIYISLGWGAADGIPDMINGVLQDMENYRHRRNCISLRFKQLKINGKPLKPREIFMLDEMATSIDPIDSTIAIAMNIRPSTYNQHSKKLKDKAGVHSKHALILKAAQEGIIRNFNTAR